MPRQSRRPPPDRRAYDDDSLDLFDLLWEQQAPSTPANWFSTSWQNGENAIRLGLALASNEKWTEEQSTLVQFLLHGHHKEATDGDAYWQASQLRTAARCDEEASSTSSTALVHTLEMFLRWKSKSDGGGALYNDHLMHICEDLLDHGGALEAIEPLVRKWRQRDVVGLGVDDPEPEDPTLQRRLRAFETAWKAGLFKIAFCV